MERREFAYLAALAVLPGCTSTISDGPGGGNQDTGDGTSQEPSDLPGLGEDGFENVDAFLDAQRTAAEENSHTAALTQTAEETFEDGFEALELRTQYDPSAGRLHFRQWWRYPDGEQSEETEIYTDGSAAAERTFDGEDNARLEPISPSAARQRYTDLRENVRDLLATLEYGPLEETQEGAGARYRLPITGVRDVEDGAPIQDVESGHLLIDGSGLVRSVELDDFVEEYRERTSDLDFEVTDVGETTVSEPDWFGDVPETTTADGGSDGDGGSVETTESDTTETTMSDPQTTTPSGEYETVVVGPERNNNVFGPEVLRIEPGTTVWWVWESPHHNIKPREQPPGADWEGFTEISDAGTTHQFTFDVEGTYEYVCEPHSALGMEGEIVVESK